MSTTVKYFAPVNLCRISSTNFAEYHGLMIHLFKCVGSKHNLILPLGFFTHTKELSHSIGSDMSTLCKIFSLQSLSNSAFRGSYIAWGTCLIGST